MRVMPQVLMDLMRHDDIETTMATVLHESESLPSTYAAMVAYADRRIAQGDNAGKEQVHAG